MNRSGILRQLRERTIPVTTWTLSTAWAALAVTKMLASGAPFGTIDFLAVLIEGALAVAFVVVPARRIVACCSAAWSGLLFAANFQGSGATTVTGESCHCIGNFAVGAAGKQCIAAILVLLSIFVIEALVREPNSESKSR